MAQEYLPSGQEVWLRNTYHQARKCGSGILITIRPGSVAQEYLLPSGQEVWLRNTYHQARKCGSGILITIRPGSVAQEYLPSGQEVWLRNTYHLDMTYALDRGQ